MHNFFRARFSQAFGSVFLARLRWIAVLVIFTLNAGCGHLFYFPSKSIYAEPKKLGLEYEDVHFMTPDGVRLHGWYFPARLHGEEEKGTVIQFHGNAQNMSSHFGSVIWLTHAGYNLFTFDYRGYGNSEGEPSQEGLYRDALAAISYVQMKKPPKRAGPDLILYGQSLGGAVLLRAYQDVRERSRIRLVVVDSGFYSYRAVARARLAENWLTFLLQPLGSLLISDEYSPQVSISEVAPTPLLVIHGNSDAVVPFDCGMEIFRLARSPKWFWAVEGGHHVDSMTRQDYRKRFLKFLDALH